MNRRDLFHPRQLAATAGQVLSAVDDLKAAAHAAVSLQEKTSKEFALLRFARPAMAATFEIMMPLGIPQSLEAAEEALGEINRIEDQLTVYRETSEVCRLNRAAPYAEIPVEERLFDLLQTAARISEDTDGAYDVSSGALIKVWGFFRGPARLPSDEERAQALKRVGMRHVVLDPQRRNVRYLRPGLEINLGSIGKGYALDRAAALLRQRWGLSAVLLHGGRSSVHAVGTEPGDERGWAVALAHPWKTGQQLALLRLRDLALGTSAATFRHLEYQGRKLSHILDPRTGWPTEGLASASVVAPTAALADALSTAFFVMGIEKARDYCDAHPEIGAVLLPEGDAAKPVFLGLAGQLADPPVP